MIKIKINLPEKALVLCGANSKEVVDKMSLWFANGQHFRSINSAINFIENTIHGVRINILKEKDMK